MLHDIQSEHKNPVKAAELLLNIVIKQSSNAYSCFLEALKLTSQQHLYELIVTGSCKGTKMLLYQQSHLLTFEVFLYWSVYSSYRVSTTAHS